MPSADEPQTTGGGASSVDADQIAALPLGHDDDLVFELISRGESIGVATLSPTTAAVFVLFWQANPDVSARALPRPLRVVVQAAFDDHAARRVEVRVPLASGPGSSSTDAAVAMRAGLRKEGIARSSVLIDGEPRDVTVFAAVAGDPAPESPESFTAMLDSVLPMKRLIAHVIIRDTDGRLLLCQTTFKSDWELPGGIVEPGEAPMTGAEREVTEEIGIELPIGRLLVLDWLPPYLGWSDAIELLYDGGQHDSSFIDELTLDQTEIKAVRWCTLDEAIELVSPLNARRLPLLIPHLPAATVHLIDGSPS